MVQKNRLYTTKKERQDYYAKSSIGLFKDNQSGESSTASIKVTKILTFLLARSARTGFPQITCFEPAKPQRSYDDIAKHPKY